MRRNRIVFMLLVTVVLFYGQILEAEVFRFQYVAGTKFRAVAQVDETVIQRFGRQQAVQQSELRYKIAYTIKDVTGDTGQLEGIFQIANRSTGDAGVYQWSEEHPTAYSRDSLGRMDVPDRYSFPVVRGVPRFPERDVSPGETWAGAGEEVHDFRESGSGLGIVSFPINVAYQYLGIEEYKGRPLHAIDAAYQVYHRFPSTRGLSPEQISGFSTQHLYWDNDQGYLAAYTEEFELVMQLNDGSSWIFRGTASAEVIQAEEMEKEKVAEDIRNSLAKDKVEDSDVRVDDQGITIALHNIRFLPDSSRFVPGEEEKIRTVAEILKRYPDQDVLVAGHTALAGTAAGRERLSVERARVTARALIELGARREDQIVIRGMGAREPVAGNDTEAGRRLNRRVEITLLEN
ncbi:OmpA family protein [Marispirochaeta sp.]|uniref:OmpA family protein n=1 Tax=Marispirochaeta sp. TaxID=2038653 RepID=UPI0029C8B351|nr:OmpA family protein [Marispirochaeta sp.]